MSLSAALAATRAGDPGTALAVLLRVWRATPARVIANAIDAVSNRASADLEPPTAPTAKARDAAWAELARAGDPIQMGMLVRTIAQTKGSDETLARIELLLAHAPDPRLSACIAGMIQRPIYNASVSRTRPFWTRVFPLLAELGDPFVLERARGFAAHWESNRDLNVSERPELAKRLAAVMPVLEATYGGGVPVVSRADMALCNEIAEAAAALPKQGPARTEAELLAAIYAAPDDDGPREVYADWLQQHGNPRGEFIALQLAKARGALTKPQAKRERMLLNEYETKWIAPLPLGKTHTRFERGFVVACRANEWIDDEPAWATVRECNVVPADDNAHAHGLRVLRAIHHRGILRLAQLTKPLAVMDLEWAGLQRGRNAFDYESRQAIDAFGRITVLPALRRLEVSPWGWWVDNSIVDQGGVGAADLAWLFAARCFATVEELRMPLTPLQLEAMLEALVPTRVRTLSTYCWIDARKPGWQLIVERDTGGRFDKLVVIAPARGPTTATPNQWGADVVTAIDRLAPDQLVAARVEVPGPSRRAFATVRGPLMRAFARQQRLAEVNYEH